MWGLSKPVGLAAGIVKNGENLNEYDDGEFGYVVVGTVTRDARIGNPEPNIFYNDDGTIINSLGYPNKGWDTLKRNLVAQTPPKNFKVVVSISGTELADVVYCHTRLEDYVWATEINISCPNVTGFSELQNPDKVALLMQFMGVYSMKPLFVKVPRYYDEDGRDSIFHLIDLVYLSGADGITLGNTKPVAKGGLSGSVLYENTLTMVRDVREAFGSDLIINACGGITEENYEEVLDVGATTVQYLTSYINKRRNYC